jgi:hypothetical protein
MRDHVEATRSLTQHIPQIERAYVSGGGDARGQSGQFRVDVNNFGKTPGEVIRIKFGNCDIGWLNGQLKPTWSGAKDWPEWIAPGRQSRPTVFFDIPRSDGKLVVYGRIYYRDIFRHGHSCGFLLLVKSDGTAEPIAAPTPPYTEDRDEPEYDA